MPTRPETFPQGAHICSEKSVVNGYTASDPSKLRFTSMFVSCVIIILQPYYSRTRGER